MSRGRRNDVLPPELFLGREREMEMLKILVRDLSREWGRSLMLCAPPGTGKTEMLRQLHAAVFDEGGDVFPVYYLLPGLRWSLGDFAADFTRSVAAQYLAFRRRDPSPPPTEEEVAAGLRQEGGGAGRLLAQACRLSGDAARPGVAREAALLPARLSEETGLKVLILLDDFPRFGGYRPDDLARWPGESLRHRTVSFILAGGDDGSMRGLVEGDRGKVETAELPPLDREGASRLVRSRLRLAGVELPGDLAGRVAELAGGRPFASEAIVRRLERSVRLDEAALCRAYASSVCGGEIGRYWLTVLESHFPDLPRRRNALEVLVFCLREEGPPVEVSQLHGEMLKSPEDVGDALERLARAGLVSIGCSRVRIADDPTLRDFLLYFYRVEAGGTDADCVEAAMAADKVLEGEKGRMSEAVKTGRGNLANLMAAWSGQQVPRSLFSARDFEQRYGADPDDDVLPRLAEEGSGLSLPEVVSVVSGAVPGGGSPPRSEVDVLAWAFHRKGKRRGGKVCWVVSLCRGTAEAGDVEEFERLVSRLEAEGGLDEAAAVKWLVAEGFSPGATSLAVRRRALTSTAGQVRLLGMLLGRDAGEIFPDVQEPKETGRLEFDMQIPMVSETELVAARAVEQLAENMNFDPEEIGRIKMALVEACINAFEHSGLEGGRVRLRFSVENESLEIRVENSGRVFGPRNISTPALRGGLKKRGWGLNLIRELMDEAEFEQTEDGARLVMVKHLRGKEGRSGNVRDND